MGTSSLLVALGAYTPESGFDSLDFNMPSYTIKNEQAPKPDNVDTRPERAPKERPAAKPGKEAKAKAGKVVKETPMKPPPKSKADKDREAAAQLAALQEKGELQAEQKARNVAEVQAQRQAVADKAAADKAAK